MTEDEMVGWHHRFNGHEFEQAPGDGDGQGSLVCYSPWDHKESDTTEQLNNSSHVFLKSRGSAGEYQADERAGVARLSWRVSGR